VYVDEAVVRPFRTVGRGLPPRQKSYGLCGLAAPRVLTTATATATAACRSVLRFQFRLLEHIRDARQQQLLLKSFHERSLVLIHQTSNMSTSLVSGCSLRIVWFPAADIIGFRVGKAEGFGGPLRFDEAGGGSTRLGYQITVDF